MEIQNAFQIQWDKTPYQSFTEYFFAKIPTHGSNLAIVDVDTGKQWRYSEIRGWCDMCSMRLRELQVSSTSRVAVITGTTGQAIFVHLACAMIGCTAVAVNGWGTVDEIWQVVDLSEATHLIVESQFMQKAEDVRRKAQMRGGGRIKHVRPIDDVLTTDAIEAKRRLETSSNGRMENYFVLIFVDFPGILSSKKHHQIRLRGFTYLGGCYKTLLISAGVSG
ncbi:unnamed protein product [Strongylus vulgaris]|uniref:AMP-dependent synthetase/ligase domain-containing protein n=1 Tax=Strongylus vulgaris TaxID=40348 RepID=A0A3P7JBN0_STRVU|nr:unnamed protein product [Strongylus vulgaris]